ncbi:hypothetical protein [Nitrospira sp. Kam-Ns4a]
MKIRRKPPKPERAARPQYVIGFSSAPPALADLVQWFNVNYGGPLTLSADQRTAGTGDARSTTVRATHGPWTTSLRLPVPAAEAESWRAALGWRHPHAAVVFRPALLPAQAANLALHAARLARGLTLLTEGTAFDGLTMAYLNPSDWQARPLNHFRLRDHVGVEQGEDAGRQWIYTQGLAKLGLDELETFRPAGLPVGPVAERLLEIAEELTRLGQMPQVGAAVSLSLLGLTVRVVGYRTAAPSGRTLQLRAVEWTPLGSGG